jgi:hypothetical protein
VCNKKADVVSAVKSLISDEYVWLCKKHNK